MSVNAGNAVAYLDLNIKKYRDGFTSAMTDLNKFKKSFANSARGIGSNLDSVGSKMMKTGGLMTATMTTAIVGVGAAVIKMTADFDSKMSGVKAILGSTAEETEKLRKQALKLGADTSFSASQAAEGMENLASAGFTTQEIMAAMPGLLDLAAAAGSDLATASEIAAGTLRGFGLEANQAGRMADVLAALAAKTNAAVEDTGEAMKYVAPVAQSYGLSLEEVSAAIGIMSNANIKGSQAGTTLRGALSRLAKPSEKSANAMKAMGFNAFDSKGKLKSLTGIVDELAKGTKNYTEEEKARAIVTIFGQEALSGMLVLMKSGAPAIAGLTKELQTSKGAAEEMAKTRLDNLKGDIEALTGSAESAGISLGTILTPKIRDLVKLATELVNKFNNLTEAQQKMVLKAGGLAAAAGPAVMGLGFLSKGVGSVYTGFANAAEGVGNFATGGLTNIKQFGKSTKGVFSDIGQLSPFKALGSGIDTVKKKGVDLGLGLKKSVGSGLSGAFEKVTGGADSALGKTLKGMSKQVGAEGPKIMGLLGKVGGGATSGLQSMVGTALKLFGPAALIGAALVGLGAVYQEFGGEIDKVLEMVMKDGPKIIKTLVEGIVTKIPELMAMGTTLLMKLLEAIIANLPAIIEGAVLILTTLVNSLAENIPRLIPLILQLIQTILVAIVENLPIIIEAGLNILLALVQGIADNIDFIIEIIVQVITMLITTLVENLPLLIEIGIKLLVAIITGLSQAIPQLIGMLPDIFHAIFESFRKVNWGEVGINLIGGIADGIASAASGLGKAVVNAAQGALETVKDFLGIHSPSTLFADKIGKFIPPGIVEGVEATAGMVGRSINQIMNDVSNQPYAMPVTATAMADATGGATSGSQTVNHTGTIRLEGYDNKDQFLGSVEAIANRLGFEAMLDYKKT